MGSLAPVQDTNIINPPHERVDSVLSENSLAIAPVLYAGLFNTASGGYNLWQVGTWDAFVSQWTTLGNTSNLRLVSIDTGVDAQDNPYFLGAWTEIGGGYSLWRTASWDSFMSQHNSVKSSMRLLDFDIHPAPDGSRNYTGTWGSTPIPQKIVADLDFNAFVAEWNTLSSSGWRLTNIQGYPTAGKFHLTGVFEQGTGGYAFLVQPDQSAFNSYYQQNKASMSLVDYQVFDDSDGTRYYIGVWRDVTTQQQFIVDQDWGSFINQWNTLATQGYRLQKTTRYPNQILLPEPQWDSFFAKTLGTQVMGYAYCVLKDGKPIAKGVHKARAPQDNEKVFGSSTRINLASVSKSVCAVAMMKLIKDRGLSLDQPFYPLVKTAFPTVGKGVDTVTIRNLMEMKSGMTPDGTLNGNIWNFLATYLANQTVDQNKRGRVEEYSNTNFTICQAIIDCVTGHANQWPDFYTTYVATNVLKPMGINTAVFSAIPDDKSAATLTYANADDKRNGTYWTQLDMVGAGGWISSADELVKFLSGLRRNVVLDAPTTELMLQGNLGFYTYNGIYGQYFSHNGGLGTGGSSPQGLETGIIRLSDGYDCLLVANSLGQDVIMLMIQAFQARN